MRAASESGLAGRKVEHSRNEAINFQRGVSLHQSRHSARLLIEDEPRNAAAHWQNASAYDAVTGTVSQGELFRAEAALAVVVGLGVLVRPRPSSWLAALLVAASALGAVLLYRYVDVGSLGPLPDMYENTWQVPGKLLSAYAEGAAVVLAGLGLMAAVLARRSAPAHRELGYGRRPGPTGRGRAPLW